MLLSTLNPAAMPIMSFCAGRYHSCAVFENMKMKCWGDLLVYGSSSSYGHNSTTVGDNIPYFNPGSSLSVGQVSCGSAGICVLLSTGQIKCVGGNNYGQTGNGLSASWIGEQSGHVGNQLPLVNLGSGVNVLGIAGGSNHFCVVTSDKKVKCFGWNFFSQLGLGDTTNRGTLASHMGDNLPYVNLGTFHGIASVHSGSGAFHTCAIFSDPLPYAQRFKCWGFNSGYQLGYGDKNNRGDITSEMGDYLALVDLGTESRVKNLALGYAYTCALLLNDIMKCWGTDNFGELASGSENSITVTGNSIPFVQFDSGKTVKFVTAGNFHTCILYDDLVTMKCVGENSSGQTGQGDTIQRGRSPATMIPFIPAIQLGTGSLKISSIHSGSYHNCIVFVDSTIKCFGWNQNGQLGIGSTSIIGDEENEMGNYLHFAEIFSPTQSPTLPTLSPTRPTSKSPTIKPTKAPTINQTKSPTKAPTRRSETSKPTKTPMTSCNYATKKRCNKDVLCKWMNNRCTLK